MDRETSPSKANNKGRGWLPIAGLVFGTAAFLFVIYFVGLDAIFEPLARVDAGFLLIVGLNGLRHLLRAINLFVAVPRDQRKFSIRHALTARLAGETINTILFAGIFGEATKAAMLNPKISLEVSATAVLVDGIIYSILSLVLIVAGAILVLSVYASGVAMNLLLISLVIFSAVIIVAIWLTIRHNFKPVSWLIKKLHQRKRAPKWLTRRREKICDIETNVVEFRDEHPKAFITVAGLVTATHALSVLEVYLAMQMLGLDVTIGGALIVESLTKAVNFIFFLIPGTVGVYEGGNSVILALLGYSAGAGVALALVRRGGILFWTLIGAIILFWRGAKSGAHQLTANE